MGSVVTRLAARKTRKSNNTRVIYTAHGFHFYKGCPFYYWMIFYPIERYLMKYTDLLLVMNKEDYDFAKKHFKNVKVKYINGVGFNKERISKKAARAEIENTYKKYGLNKEITR